MSSDPRVLAQDLLDLVKSIDETPSSPQTASSFDQWNARIQIQNICDRILAQVMGPSEYAILVAESCQESQALHFVTALGVPDLIGDGIATLADLSKRTAVQPPFLSVSMNCLIGRGIFEEVGQPGSCVYRNNRFSEVLRADHPKTIKSAIGFVGDEGFRATSRLLDAARIVSPVSQDQGKKERITATNLALVFEGSVFAWMSAPEQAWRNRRLGQAMQQLHGIMNGNVLEDYPWQELPFPIVDVGSGIGSLESSLLKSTHTSDLEFILFDNPGTIENARRFWASQDPTISKNITFVSGDFMAQTPEETNIPTGKPTYVIRHVLHDWADEDVLVILRNVRRAMPADGRLLLVEMLLYPESSRLVRTTSMQVLALNNGMTRTQEAVEELLHLAGFKVARVTKMRAVDSIIESILEP